MVIIYSLCGIIADINLSGHSYYKPCDSTLIFGQYNFFDRDYKPCYFIVNINFWIMVNINHIVLRGVLANYDLILS